MTQDAPFFFDVTEVYLLSRKSEEVTGVQRVVLEFAYELCALRLAVPIVVHPLDDHPTALDPDLFDMAALYNVDRFIEKLGVPPKLRSLDKYRGRPVRRAFHAVVQAVVRWRGRLMRRPVGLPVRAAGGRYVLFGSAETNRRSARAIRRTDPAASIHAMIYDIIPVRMGDGIHGARAAFAAAYGDLVTMGVRFMTDSRHARDDLLAAVAEGLLADPGGPVGVQLLAAELRAPPVVPPMTTEQPFLLMVGSTGGRKNAVVVFEAYRRLLAEGVALPRLVCAGRMPRSAAADFGPGGRWSGLAGHVSLVDQPDHATLYALYEQATALVFPSRYEGYGLPLGEAQWVGTPVLSSRATSLPEAGGEAPEYFDPDDVDGLAALLRRLATDPGWLADLRARTSAARDGLRSWRDCALALDAAVGLAAADTKNGRPGFAPPSARL